MPNYNGAIHHRPADADYDLHFHIPTTALQVSKRAGMRYGVVRQAEALSGLAPVLASNTSVELLVSMRLLRGCTGFWQRVVCGDHGGAVLTLPKARARPLRGGGRSVPGG